MAHHPPQRLLGSCGSDNGLGPPEPHRLQSPSHFQIKTTSFSKQTSTYIFLFAVLPNCTDFALRPTKEGFKTVLQPEAAHWMHGNIYRLETWGMLCFTALVFPEKRRSIYHELQAAKWPYEEQAGPVSSSSSQVSRRLLGCLDLVSSMRPLPQAGQTHALASLDDVKAKRERHQRPQHHCLVCLPWTVGLGWEHFPSLT